MYWFATGILISLKKELSSKYKFYNILENWMMKSLKTFIISIVFLSVTFSQELCPPALVEALFYDEKIELSWDQTTSWGDLLF